MARGQRRSDEELLAEYETQITEFKSRQESIQKKIDILEQKKQDIIDGKRQKEAEELLSMIENSGMSLDEIKELLQGKQEQVS